MPSIELSTVATPEVDEDQKDAPITEVDSWIIHIENEEATGEKLKGGIMCKCEGAN